MRIWLVILSVALLSCKKEGSKVGLLLDNEITSGGLERDYHLYVPSEGSNWPLVILLHGGGGNNTDLIGQSNVKAPYAVWLTLAEANQFMVAAPNGTLGSTNKQMWNDCRNDSEGNPTVDDVSFIEDMINDIGNKFSHDVNRTYVMGTSNGGHMSIRLAEELPNKITAFAAVVASNSASSQCTNSSVPVSALFMNGTLDPILPYEGGQMSSNRGLVHSTDSSVTYWVNKNGCDTIPITQNMVNSNTSDGCSVVKSFYQNGTNNTEVALYQVVNGGHAEPSIEERYSNFYLSFVGNQNGDFEMAKEVWDFFKTKSK